jgi:hypothetical protein
MRAPPTTSLWPPRYLVALCITTSMPSFKGCCKTGVAKVLSQTAQAPAAWAMSATAAMSTSFNKGFDGVSIQTRRVSLVMAVFRAVRSLAST